MRGIYWEYGVEVKDLGAQVKFSPSTNHIAVGTQTARFKITTSPGIAQGQMASESGFHLLPNQMCLFAICKPSLQARTRFKTEKEKGCIRELAKPFSGICFLLLLDAYYIYLMQS